MCVSRKLIFFEGWGVVFGRRVAVFLAFCSVLLWWWCRVAVVVAVVLLVARQRAPCFRLCGGAGGGALQIYIIYMNVLY